MLQVNNKDISDVVLMSSLLTMKIFLSITSSVSIAKFEQVVCWVLILSQNYENKKKINLGQTHSVPI